MPGKKDIKPFDTTRTGFYDHYVEGLIDGMPVHLSKGAAAWLTQLSDEHQQDEIDKAIALWGKRPH